MCKKDSPTKTAPLPKVPDDVIGQNGADRIPQYVDGINGFLRGKFEIAIIQNSKF